MHPSDVVTGYRAAAAKVMELLPSLSTVDLGEDDVRDPAKLAVPLRSVIAAKQLGLEGVVAPLVAQACVNVMPAKPRKPSINIDNVRVAKIVGGNVRDSQVVRGMVVLRDAEGTIKHVEGAKVAVFGVGLEASETETKGTVVLKSAEELKSYTDGEEARMEASIKAIADSGATVVVSGGSISEIALHYIEKFGLMALKIVSKFELRRLCRATGATALVKLEAPTEADLGRADVVSVQELSGRRVVVVRQDDEESAISTIVLRGATTSLLDDLERSVDGAVNAARNLCRDGRSLPGAGATETALALKLAEFAGTKTGLEQYAITKFADALEVVPRTLAENSGRSATETMSRLFAEHTAGKGAQGVLIDPESAEATVDTEEEAIHDGYAAKESALKLAADAAITVLRVDHIIMSKQAGGPKPRAPGPPDM